MVNALEPPAFKIRIQDRLALEVFKKYRKDPVAAKKWITEDLKNFLEYAGESVMRAGRKSEPKKDNKVGATHPGKSDAPASHSSQGQQIAQTTKPRKRMECLKCGSLDHLVRVCPKVSREEADQLIEGLTKKAEGHVRKLMDPAEKKLAGDGHRSGHVKATLEGCVLVVPR
jgi:hypothetical protein